VGEKPFTARPGLLQPADRPHCSSVAPARVPRRWSFKVVMGWYRGAKGLNSYRDDAGTSHDQAPAEDGCAEANTKCVGGNLGGRSLQGGFLAYSNIDKANLSGSSFYLGSTAFCARAKNAVFDRIGLVRPPLSTPP
jgi:hypothetical protein